MAVIGKKKAATRLTCKVSQEKLRMKYSTCVNHNTEKKNSHI